MKPVIFDFDGVIVKSEEVHRKTFMDLLDPYGIKIGKNEWYEKFAGTGSKNIFGKLIGDRVSDEKIEELVEKRVDLIIEYAKKGEIDPVKGLKAFVNKVEKKALVSGGNKRYIKKLLEILDLEFNTIITPEDTQRTKPYPDPFLYAAKELDVEPERCVVIEDSFAGCKAARRAGMSVVWMEPEINGNKSEPDCDLVIKDFNDSRLKELIYD